MMTKPFMRDAYLGKNPSVPKQTVVSAVGKMGTGKSWGEATREAHSEVTSRESSTSAAQSPGLIYPQLQNERRRTGAGTRTLLGQ